MLTNLHFFNPPEKQGLKDMYKFFLPSCRLNLRKFSFSQRVVSEWNSLSPKAVYQMTVNGFKNIIDSIFRKRRGLHISQYGCLPQFSRHHQRSSLVGSSELSSELCYLLFLNLTLSYLLGSVSGVWSIQTSYQ